MDTAIHEEPDKVCEDPPWYANYEWKVPNTVDTRFRIASITKPFTMVLVFQLCEEGVLHAVVCAQSRLEVMRNALFPGEIP